MYVAENWSTELKTFTAHISYTRSIVDDAYNFQVEIILIQLKTQGVLFFSVVNILCNGLELDVILKKKRIVHCSRFCFVSISSFYCCRCALHAARNDEQGT